MAIRLQPITAPNFSDSNQLLLAANQQIGGALQGLQNTLGQYRDEVVKRNTAQAVGLLTGATDANDLAQRQQQVAQLVRQGDIDPTRVSEVAATMPDTLLGRQTVALVVLTLLMVLWASARITAPVKKLDTMIRSIGQASHHFPHDKVDGPRELTELGEQLRWLASRLQQLEALRLILLRHASHELKTPLSSIREGCALLSEQLVGPLNAQQMEVVSLLNGSADRLSVLTEQLLDYNKLLQQAKPEFGWHDSETLLQNCFNDHALSLQQRGQKIVLDCQLPRIYTDSMLFRRILDNLINNAQAYGAEGSNVWVNLRQHDKFMLLDVANNGTPIPAELRAKLFEPFQRGKAPRFDAVQGSGLGSVS